MWPIAWVSAWVVAAPPAIPDYFPCVPGRFAIYRVERGGIDTGRRIHDVVRGPGREPHTCVVDREDTSPGRPAQRDAYVREIFSDRITNAGREAQPPILRTPILKAPLEAGRKWRFNRTHFSLAAVGARIGVPAGTFVDCVRVVETTPEDPSHRVVTVFAPGVGLISSAQGSERWLLVEAGEPAAVRKGGTAPKSEDRTGR